MKILLGCQVGQEGVFCKIFKSFTVWSKWKDFRIRQYSSFLGKLVLFAPRQIMYPRLQTKQCTDHCRGMYRLPSTTVKELLCTRLAEISANNGIQHERPRGGQNNHWIGNHMRPQCRNSESWAKKIYARSVKVRGNGFMSPNSFFSWKLDYLLRWTQPEITSKQT